MATREQRIRERLFPGVKTYDKSRGAFTAVPTILRRAQFLFSPRAWQVYCCVLMKTGPAGVAWMTLEELAWDLDFKSTSKLKPYLDELINDGWLARQSSRGKDYYLAPDPVALVDKLRRTKKLSPERREDLEELFELLYKAAPEDAAS